MGKNVFTRDCTYIYLKVTSDIVCTINHLLSFFVLLLFSKIPPMITDYKLQFKKVLINLVDVLDGFFLFKYCHFKLLGPIILQKFSLQQDLTIYFKYTKIVSFIIKMLRAQNQLSNINLFLLQLTFHERLSLSQISSTGQGGLGRPTQNRQC